MREIDLHCYPHPLSGEHRRSERFPASPGWTLKDIVRYFVDDGLACAVAVDGIQVDRDDWEIHPLDDATRIVIRTVCQDDDSDAVQIILSVALALAAPVLGEKLAVAAGWKTWVGTGIVLVGGGLLLSALIPPPELPQPGSSEQSERSYSLTGGGNRLRPYAPLLLVLGRHRVFPDLAARQYTEFRDGEQYLAQLYDWGIGDLAVTELQIGETGIQDFEEVTSEWLDPGESPTIVAADVDTVDGADLEDTEWVIRTSSLRTQRLGLDFSARLMRVSESGSIRSQSVTLDIGYRLHGSDDDWTASEVILTNDSQGIHHRTVTITPANAGSQWDVRVRRRSARSDNDRIYDDVAWSQLRTYQTGTAGTGGRRLALEIRASGQLSGRLDRFSGMVEQKIETFDGAAWSNDRSSSSNPAEIFRWYARGVRDASGALVAGAGLDDDRIDDASIEAWQAWCESKSLSCDAVIDAAMSVKDVQDIITRCGRASVSWETGKLGVVYDDDESVPSAYISAENIIAGSLSVSYVSGPLADEIIYTFIDPDFDWQPSEVRRQVDPDSPVTRSVKAFLRGVTNRRQAAEECNLAAARQSLQRRVISWTMTLEALAVQRGSVVWMSHSLVSGGSTGRIAGGTPETPGLGRPVRIDADSVLLVRLPDGTLHQSRALPAGDDSCTLADPLPVAAEDLVSGDCLWRLYDDSAPPLQLKVTAIEPTSSTHVRVSAVDFDRRYYAAATSDLTAPIPVLRFRPPRIVSAFFSERLVQAGRGHVIEIQLSVSVAGDWRGGDVLVDGSVVAVMGSASTDASWIEPERRTITVTVVPGSAAAPAGTAYSATYDIEGASAKPPPPENFLLDVLGDGTRRYRWTESSAQAIVGYVLRYAETADDLTLDSALRLNKGVVTESPFEINEPRAGRWSFALAAVSSYGVESDAVWIHADLPRERLGNRVHWDSPSEAGWPGTITGGSRSDDGRAAIESSGDYTWSALTTWDAWSGWALNDGDDGVTQMTYTHTVIELPVELNFIIEYEADVAGSEALEYQTDASVGGTTWTAYETESLLTATRIRLRWTITGDGSQVLEMDHLRIEFLGNTGSEQILDADTSGWAGSAAAGRIIPVTRLSVMTACAVTLQSVGAGWTWELLDKAARKIRIHDSNGAAADAVIDVIAYGPLA